MIWYRNITLASGLMGSISVALKQPKMLWAAKFWRTGMEVRDLINIIYPFFDSIHHSFKGLSKGLYLLATAQMGLKEGISGGQNPAGALLAV